MCRRYPASSDDTPAQYADKLRAFIRENPNLCQSGDILDGYADADGLKYWRDPAHFPRPARTGGHYPRTSIATNSTSFCST